MSSLESTFERYFTVKTSADVEGTMAFFSPDLVCYVDATLGWDLPGFDALVTRITTVYDSRQLDADRKRALVLASIPD
jgi:hypothetical protein